MDNNAMKFLSRRLPLLIAAVMSLTLAAGALPAAAQEISPEHLAIARKYVDLTDKAAIFEGALVKTAIDTMRTIVSQDPELSEPTDKAITKTLEYYKPRKGELFDQFARVYALNFTQEELQQIVDFYSSPVGLKLSAANATLNDSMQAVMQVFEANLQTEFFAKVRGELKDGGFSF